LGLEEGKSPFWGWKKGRVHFGAGRREESILGLEEGKSPFWGWKMKEWKSPHCGPGRMEESIWAKEEHTSQPVIVDCVNQKSPFRGWKSSEESISDWKSPYLESIFGQESIIREQSI
jgi:hypothetical protein